MENFEKDYLFPEGDPFAEEDLYYLMIGKDEGRPMPNGMTERYQLTADRWVEMKSFQLLSQIREIVKDDSLRENGCWEKIQEIIEIFENLDTEHLLGSPF